MKITINGKEVYDQEKDIVCILLEDQHKENIKNMHPDCSVYAVFPDDADRDALKEHMKQLKEK